MQRTDAGWELLVQVIEGNYDPACERIDTAIKAVWLLYRRAKWKFLGELGLPRHEIEPVFDGFDLEFITADHGRITREEQVARLLVSLPPPLRMRLLYAALELVRRYMNNTQPARRAYYARAEQGEIA